MELIKQKIKSEITHFYKNEEYLDHENRPHQLNILKAFSAKISDIEIHGEHRNYNHSIELMLHFNENGEYVPIEFHSDDALNYLLKTKEKLYRAIVSISDIGSYIIVYWNKVSLVDKKQTADFIQDVDVPHLPKTNLSKILNQINQVQEITIIGEPEKSEKQNWLKEIEGFQKVKYTPTLEELLFGGLDIYNEFGL